MCWLQFYGLWVIQDPKMHSAVIKVPTVFKAPPPHPLETYRRCCSFSGSCSIPSYHLLLYIYFGAGNWSTVKNGTGHIQQQEIDPLNWQATCKIKGSGQKGSVGMIGNFRHGLEKILGLDCAHQRNRIKDQAWKQFARFYVCLLSRTCWSTCLEQKWRSIMPHLFEKIVMRKT